jgi:hypothetical protein
VREAPQGSGALVVVVLLSAARAAGPRVGAGELALAGEPWARAVPGAADLMVGFLGRPVWAAEPPTGEAPGCRMAERLRRALRGRRRDWVRLRKSRESRRRIRIRREERGWA